MEVTAAELVKVLMQNEVEIDVETEIITWPMGVTSKPPESKHTKEKQRMQGPLPTLQEERIVSLAF